MDWLRRLLGFSERPNSNIGPQSIPSWEEIQDYRYRDGPLRPEQPPIFDHRGNFSEDDPFNWHGRDMRDTFNSMFSQMDEAFSHMNSMLSQMDSIFGQMTDSFHDNHPGQVIIMELPDYPSSDQQQQQERCSPRDQLLKVPDSELPDPHSPPSFPRPSHPLHPESWGDDDNDGGGGGGEFPGDGGVPGFGGRWGFKAFDPMSMFEQFFRGYGMGPFGGGNPDHPIFHHSDDCPFQDHSRESLLKKDSDLDDRDVSQLLREGPSYEGHKSGPEWAERQPTGGMFRSTTTVRIRRPDGSIREEKRYTDSTGREKVVVTDTKPEGDCS